MNDDELMELLRAMAQRLAINIAAIPLHLRNEAYEALEQALRDTAYSLELEPRDACTFVSFQVQLIRDAVAKIDADGKTTDGQG